MSREAIISPGDELTEELLLVEKTEKDRQQRFCEELLRTIVGGHREAAENLFKQLEDKSINLDTVDSHGTALFVAVYHGLVDVVEFLVSQGANVNWTRDDRYELIDLPLHLAIENKRIELARVLLKAGADVNKKNLKHRTPLYVAVESGSSEMVNMLLTNGAAIEVNWTTYRCPINSALDTLYGEVKKSMVNSALHSRPRKYESLESMVLTLLRHGVPVNGIDVWGNTLLYTALQTSDHGASRLLIECGAIYRRGRSTALRYRPFVRTSKRDPMLKEWIEEQLTATPSLQSLCGRVIRLHLVKTHRRSILGHLEKLPLPKIIIEDLTLERFVKQSSLAN